LRHNSTRATHDIHKTVRALTYSKLTAGQVMILVSRKSIRTLR